MATGTIHIYVDNSVLPSSISYIKKAQPTVPQCRETTSNMHEMPQRRERLRAIFVKNHMKHHHGSRATLGPLI